jgi:hypothetical protein
MKIHQETIKRIAGLLSAFDQRVLAQQSSGKLLVAYTPEMTNMRRLSPVNMCDLPV